MLRAEGYSAPPSALAAAGVTYSPGCHGSGGPIGVQLNPEYPGDLERNLNQTALNKGLPYATDNTCGNPAGLAPMAHTKLDNTRIDACGFCWAVRADGRPRIHLRQGPAQPH